MSNADEEHVRKALRVKSSAKKSSKLLQLVRYLSSRDSSETKSTGKKRWMIQREKVIDLSLDAVEGQWAGGYESEKSKNLNSEQDDESG
ncbi:hypothetical protein Tco_0837587 [Tanacetum coccineum]